MMLHAPLALLAGLFVLSLALVSPQAGAGEETMPVAISLTFAALR